MTNYYPLLTIVTVVYNGEQYLEETINNVLNLNYPNLDYIIIDGGSVDRTVDLIQKYADRLKYWVSESDHGIYDAMNKGWEQAALDSYILFLGAGDKVLKLPDVEIFKLNPDVIVGNVYLNKNLLFRSKIDFRLKLGNTIHHQAMLVRKSIQPEPPFSLKFKTYSDFDFNQRLLQRKSKFLIDKNFIGYALEGGVSAQFNAKESLEIVEKNFGFAYFILAKIYYLVKNQP